MINGNPRLGYCLCGNPAEIRDTKAADGRLHFICQAKSPEGKALHYGFVDAHDAWRLEDGTGDIFEELAEMQELVFGEAGEGTTTPAVADIDLEEFRRLVDAM